MGRSRIALTVAVRLARLAIVMAMDVRRRASPPALVSVFRSSRCQCRRAHRGETREHDGSTHSSLTMTHRSSSATLSKGYAVGAWTLRRVSPHTTFCDAVLFRTAASCSDGRGRAFDARHIGVGWHRRNEPLGTHHRSRALSCVDYLSPAAPNSERVMRGATRMKRHPKSRLCSGRTATSRSERRCRQLHLQVDRRARSRGRSIDTRQTDRCRGDRSPASPQCRRVR